MKKIFIFIFLLSTINLMGKNTEMLEFRIGGNLGAKYKEINTESFSTDEKPSETGFEGMIELIHEPIDNLITGLGTGYQRSGRIGINGGKYGVIDTIPIYLTVKYRFETSTNFSTYIKVNLGASIPYTRSDLERSGTQAQTGFYYALGGGMEYYNVIVDLSYQWTSNKTDKSSDGGYDAKVESSRITLGIGYRLGI
jgi:opacity protein-like surface antigen